MDTTPVISTLINENKFLTSIKTVNHTFSADEPIEAGGTDTAPDPVKLALGALGACTAMTLKMYYKHKKTEWSQIDVHVKSELISIDKEKDSEALVRMANNGKVRKVTKTIYIRSDMDDKLLSRASIIAEKCPVNLMMKNSCLMETIVNRS
ncbi:MAG: OsmC family protein [Balneolales bacterium]|nr:OsmC family protein [Balneolales bacterium]